jgi:hypothetical protein
MFDVTPRQTLTFEEFWCHRQYVYLVASDRLEHDGIVALTRLV